MSAIHARRRTRDGSRAESLRYSFDLNPPGCPVDDLSSIPQPVRAFIAEHVRTLMSLELLMAIRADSQREWTGAELAKELRSASEWVERELQDMARRGLVSTADTPPRYRYAPAQASLRKVIDELAGLYPDRRHSILQIIFSAPSGPIQSFADAFRFRKEPSDG